jgi:exo-1,4-beta-D-glucosaminidase
MPPDKNMGIFREVFITTSGPVTLRYPQVATHFSSLSLETAELTVNAELTNATNGEVEGTLQGVIEGIRFAQKVTLSAQETKAVVSPGGFSELSTSSGRAFGGR